MSRYPLPLSFAFGCLAGTALADVPRVAVDIAPVHSLVTRVMDGVGSPDLIVAPGGSPHEYSLKPSEATALQEADLVVWVGADLTPWLEGAIETLSGDAAVIELMEVEGTTRLDFREDAMFEAHDHEADGHEDNDEHAHHEEQEAHDEHDEHSEHEEHEDHAEREDAHGHAHGAHDPHAWLSPANATIWLNTIAAALSTADPDNAGAYFANAAEAREELVVLSAEIDAVLEPVRGRNFIVFHDAYQYFEESFDFPALGAISLSDASDPSPARITEILDRVTDQNVTCVLSEPQFDPGLVAAVMDGSQARTAVLDPLGSDLEPGAALYPQMLRNLATTLADCL